jgi:NADPH-dependent 7-cyano-7-deazaguanine reductase QueF
MLDNRELPNYMQVLKEDTRERLFQTKMLKLHLKPSFQNHMSTHEAMAVKIIKYK